MRTGDKMTLRKLSPTTTGTILVALSSLMASLSPPVLTLETGYLYGTNENPTTTEQYRDLKCSYVIAGIKHMRFIKLMLDDGYVLTRNVINLVNRYRIYAVVCTLYDVTHVKIGSLWLLLLYVNTARFYYEHYFVGRKNEAGGTAVVDRLMIVHDYVTGKMQEELSVAGCRPDNPFDTYENWYSQKTAPTPNGKIELKDIRKEGLNNCDDLNRLLDANHAQSTYESRLEALKSKHLFFNNLGIITELKSKLMNRYDVQIVWYGTSEMLEEDLQYAQNMVSPTVTVHPLFSIKKYYTGVFSLFKCIMYRLTWKFLLYVDEFTGVLRENYINQWHDLLAEFQKLLCIEDDPETTSLLGAIDRLGRNDLAVTDVIEPLSRRLHSFNVTLLCKATNAMALQPGRGAIDSDSFTNAQAFIGDLRSAFRYVDFGVIRSIVLYINEIDKW